MKNRAYDSTDLCGDPKEQGISPPRGPSQPEHADDSTQEERSNLVHLEKRGKGHE
jgi:hypothetical protein